MTAGIATRIERLGDAAWLVRCDRPGCDYFAWTAQRAFFSGHHLSVEERDAYLARRMRAHEEEMHPEPSWLLYDLQEWGEASWTARELLPAVKERAPGL